MFNKSFLNLFSLVILNCVGSGVLNLIPSLAPFGINAFVGWNLGAIGCFAVVMIFLKVGTFYKVDDYAIQNLVAAPFSSNLAEILRKYVFWMYLLFGVMGNGTVSISLMQAIRYFLPYFTTQYESICFFLIFLFFYILNRFGVNFSKGLNLFLSILKILIMAVFPLVVVFILPCAIPFKKVFSLSMIKQSVFLTTWPFVGIESILMERDIDKKYFIPGMISGLVFCLGIYTLNNYLMITNIPNLANCTSPYLALFDLVFSGSKLAGIFVNVSIILMASGSLYGWIYICIITCMSAEEYIPKALIKKNAYGIPEPMLGFCCFTTPIMLVLMKKLFPQRNIFELVIEVSLLLLLLIYILGLVAFAISKRDSWKQHLALYKEQTRFKIYRELEKEGLIPIFMKRDSLENENHLAQEETLLSNCPFISWILANLIDFGVFLIGTIFIFVAIAGSELFSMLFKLLV